MVTHFKTITTLNSLSKRCAAFLQLKMLKCGLRIVNITGDLWPDSKTDNPYSYLAKPLPVGRVTHTRASFIQFINDLLEIIRFPLEFH
jgi:hypothetical protein